MEKLDNIAKKQVEKIKQKKEIAPTQKSDVLPMSSTDLTPAGVEALASMTWDKLHSEANTPHEQLAADLLSKALKGQKSALNIYWNIQKEIYKANAKKPNQSFKIEVKRDAILSQALDNIEAEVLEGETVSAKCKVDKKE